MSTELEGVTIEYANNSKLIGNALKKAIEKGLEDIGRTAAAYADGLAPEDTGFLKNSITYAVGGKETSIKEYKANKPSKGETEVRKGEYKGTAPKENAPYVVIGTNVEYATAQELGTSKMAACPYLRPAATEHSSEYKKLMEESLKNG